MNPKTTEPSMRMTSLFVAAVSAALSTLALAQGTLVKVDGSSTVYPVTEAVAEEFQKAEKNAIRVTVGISGTGGGFEAIHLSVQQVANVRDGGATAP